MKKILVAVDGSEASIHAVRVGLDLADAQGATVTLAWVAPPPYVPPEVPFVPLPPADAAADAERVFAQVEKVVERKDLGRLALEGPVAERLADAAEQDGYDLVVVGSKGRGAVARMLIGSVTDRLVHICRKPVLVVR